MLLSSANNRNDLAQSAVPFFHWRDASINSFVFGKAWMCFHIYSSSNPTKLLLTLNVLAFYPLCLAVTVTITVMCIVRHEHA